MTSLNNFSDNGSDVEDDIEYEVRRYNALSVYTNDVPESSTHRVTLTMVR